MRQSLLKTLMDDVLIHQLQQGEDILPALPREAAASVTEAETLSLLGITDPSELTRLFRDTQATGRLTLESNGYWHSRSLPDPECSIQQKDLEKDILLVRPYPIRYKPTPDGQSLLLFARGHQLVVEPIPLLTEWIDGLNARGRTGLRDTLELLSENWPPRSVLLLLNLLYQRKAISII